MLSLESHLIALMSCASDDKREEGGGESSVDIENNEEVGTFRPRYRIRTVVV